MAKGRDLEDAASDVESVKEARTTLKQSLTDFSDRLENIRERIEGAARLHHLLGLDLKEKDVQMEMQRLAEKIGAVGLIERCRDYTTKKAPEPKDVMVTSTPNKDTENGCSCWRDENFDSKPNSRALVVEQKMMDNNQDDDEDHSKMADSGLGGCERCEGNDKLVRTCSCQSFDEPANACGKR